MGDAIDKRPEVLPDSKDAKALIPWVIRALGPAAGIAVAVLLVHYLYGDLIAANIQADTDASNAIAAKFADDNARNAAWQPLLKAKTEAETALFLHQATK